MVGSVVIHVEQDASYRLPENSCPQDVEIFRDGSVDLLDYDLNYDMAAVEFGYSKSQKLKLYEFVASSESYSPMSFMFELNAMPPIHLCVRLVVDAFEHLLDVVARLGLGIDEIHRADLPRFVEAVAEINETTPRTSKVYELNKYMVPCASVKLFVDSNVMDMIGKRDPDILKCDLASFMVRVHDTIYRLDAVYDELVWFVIDQTPGFGIRNILFSMCITARLAFDAYNTIHPDDQQLDSWFDQEKLWQLGRLMDYLGDEVP